MNQNVVSLIVVVITAARKSSYEQINSHNRHQTDGLVPFVVRSRGYLNKMGIVGCQCPYHSQNDRAYLVSEIYHQVLANTSH